MLRNLNPDNRRILNFPAVRPCESISPAILLTSLITYSTEIINFKSNFFPSQKRISHEVIRQVGILYFFFEEIRDQQPKYTKSLILCLSELHFTLQKIHFLLQDCTREGCSLYVLMKSHLISGHFRVLVGSIGTALDILQLSSLEISTEVKELVELLVKQAQKLKVEVNLKDQCAMERVILIMNQFENKFEPERGLIKRVLDYLGIHSWGDCNKEVKFLEEEMSNVEEKEEEREVPLISNLLGFMCYCRGVVLESLDENAQIMEKSVGEMLNCLNPEDFRCPISLELMMDPVTISTGMTYDRVSIQKWLKSGHMLCPKTGEKLKTTELVSNSALKKLIHQFCRDNGISISKPGRRNKEVSKTIASPGLSSSSTGAMRFLAQFLAGRLTYGTEEQKNKAAYEIRLLTKSSNLNRLILIEAGNVPPLLDLLTSTDANTQENAIAAILKLAKHPKGQKSIIEEGGLMLVISVLRAGMKIESRQIAAATIFYLSAVEKYRKLIGSTREAIPSLINLIKDGTMCGKKNAIAAIFGLLLYQRNHEKALESGIIPTLIELMSTIERSDLLADSLAVSACLAEKVDGCIAMLQTSALSLILGMLIKSSISKGGKEYCGSILASMSINGGDEVIAILAKEEALMPCLYALATDGGAHASKKARTLINMLQKFQESSSSNIDGASKVKKDKFVHVVWD